MRTAEPYPLVVLLKIDLAQLMLLHQLDQPTDKVEVK
jgi:hypothetical protein